MINIELTNDMKITFLKEMIKDLESKQVTHKQIEPKQTEKAAEPLIGHHFCHDNPYILRLIDKHNIEPVYGEQWLWVKNMWHENGKFVFKCQPGWQSDTLVKTILLKDYKYIASIICKRLFKKEYKQTKKLFETLHKGLVGNYVLSSINKGKTAKYDYSVGDFMEVKPFIEPSGKQI
tara:strand:- start:1734 stop:2264 length:531 start_codon:yes stop_codon:yes gene_type:complete